MFRIREGVPHFLSATRLLAGLWFYAAGRVPSDWLVLFGLAAAWATDIADGWLARRFGVASNGGALMDSISDKFLLVLIVLSLSRADAIPDLLLWSLAVVFTVTAMVGGVHLAVQRIAPQPTKTGRASAAVAVVAVLLAVRYPHLGSPLAGVMLGAMLIHMVGVVDDLRNVRPWTQRSHPSRKLRMGSRFLLKAAAPIALVAVAFFIYRLRSQSTVERPCILPSVVQGLRLSPSPEVSPGAVRIVTLNIASEASVERIVSELRALEEHGKIDVALLQEVGHSTTGVVKSAQALADELDMNWVYAAEDPIEPKAARSLATLSRYPLRDPKVFALKRVDRLFNPRCRIALAATVERPVGPLRIFNLHLDTRITFEQRIEQLRPVVEAAEAFAGPRLIAGDFNTLDVLWLANLLPVPLVERQGKLLQLAMEARGFYTPFSSPVSTFDYLRLRLDWIFLHGLTAVSWGVREVDFSDHHALWVEVR